ncbi:MAG: DinB family protein [Planctomycetes bacterium]|nr:DinB family protein [Planctomycetota bacterium]
MNVKTLIIEGIEMAHSVTNAYLADLTDADLVQRPVPGMNHIAWQLGHLIGSERGMIAGLGHPMPELPAGFEAAHAKETSSVNDPAKFAKKADYLALIRKMHDATIAALKATPDADLDKPAPEAMRSYAATVGSVFNIIGPHELMHAGQFVALRRKLGKPVTI